MIVIKDYKQFSEIGECFRNPYFPCGRSIANISHGIISRAGVEISHTFQGPFVPPGVKKMRVLKFVTGPDLGF